MRITHFRIENFKSIRLAECSAAPDFMVVCGGNGCGKSALLSAVVFAKEVSGGYGTGFGAQPNWISADASESRITLTLAFDEAEQVFLKSPPLSPPHHFRLQPFTSPSAAIRVILRKGPPEQMVTSECPDPVRRLLSSYSRSLQAPGFFDFIDAHRLYPRMQVSSWEPHTSSDETAKATLVLPSQDQTGPMHQQNAKFHLTKRYLAAMVMRDLQLLQKSQRTGTLKTSDSLAEFRELFNEFLAPLRFVDVDVSVTPFRYIVSTPRGEIDIDDLSSGEKEVLNVFARFHQLQPKRAIILFDEADAHLHPDLQRRYLAALRKLGKAINCGLLRTHPK